ncbi:unnamed protein product, partial [Adineta steineri]
NNGQLHQKLLPADAEPANIDPYHRSLILKFVDLLDGDGYSVEKMSAARMRPGHRSRFYEPNSLLYHFNLHDPNVSLDVACSSS